MSLKSPSPSREVGGDVWWVPSAKEVIIRSGDDSRPNHTVVSGKDYLTVGALDFGLSPPWVITLKALGIPAYGEALRCDMGG
jgi:hypothetical protein